MSNGTHLKEDRYRRGSQNRDFRSGIEPVKRGDNRETASTENKPGDGLNAQSWATN